MAQPLILVTNDDGITAPGIRNLVEIASELGEVIVVAVDDGRNPAVRVDGQELGLLLCTGADVDGMDAVVESKLFESGGGLPAVGSFPGVEVDHFVSPSSFIPG